MADPFVPRHPQGTASDVGHHAPAVDLVRTIGLVFRGLALFIVLGLFIFGAYYAVDVFLHLGKLVKNPADASGPIDQVAEIIDAQQLVIGTQGQTVNVGRVAAFALYGVSIVLWAWIPLSIMSVSGRLLLLLATGRKPPPPPPQS
ncbi:MAG: hypothetical protein U1A77_15450 [Pirellulales bacterium]